MIQLSPVRVLDAPECDSCIHLLLDDAEFIEYNLDRMILELRNISIGAEAVERLSRINITVHRLRVSV